MLFQEQAIEKVHKFAAFLLSIRLYYRIKAKENEKNCIYVRCYRCYVIGILR